MIRMARTACCLNGDSGPRVRVARLVAMAYELMQGDAPAARQWPREPKKSMDVNGH